MAEQGDKNEHISDEGKKLDALADMIRDACAKLDEGTKRLDARMDAAEERFREMDARRDAEERERSDAAKKDEDEDGEKGEPKEPVADRRKDSAGERQKEGYVSDKDEDEESKADADEDGEEESKADADGDDKDEDGAEADHMPMTRAEAAALRRQIAELNARAPAILSMADRERFATIQEQADTAFQAFGDRAPAPMQGETPLQYKRRLGSKLQSHSPKWGNVRLSAIADEASLDVITNDIYSDAITAAKRGVAVPQGQLREVVHQRGGHTIIEFEGFADSWMNQFAGNSQRATGNWMRPN